MDKEKKGSEALLEWYDSHRRKLPWREDPTPYHVWISEIMLQQTRVEAVRGYYARFVDRFPDIQSLAEAEEDECLKLWEGLGYYSRVRNMQKAAREIMSAYGGEMPRTASELRKLPGIGPYTSAAIASIAYGEKIPAVDGNLLRIFSRLALYEKEIRTPDGPGIFRLCTGAGSPVPGESRRMSAEFFLPGLPQQALGFFTGHACKEGAPGRQKDHPYHPGRRTGDAAKTSLQGIAGRTL